MADEGGGESCRRKVTVTATRVVGPLTYLAPPNKKESSFLKERSKELLLL
jgi:hypothetical protein